MAAADPPTFRLKAYRGTSRISNWDAIHTRVCWNRASRGSATILARPTSSSSGRIHISEKRVPRHFELTAEPGSSRRNEEGSTRSIEASTSERFDNWQRRGKGERWATTGPYDLMGRRGHPACQDYSNRTFGGRRLHRIGGEGDRGRGGAGAGEPTSARNARRRAVARGWRRVG